MPQPKKQDAGTSFFKRAFQRKQYTYLKDGGVCLFSNYEQSVSHIKRYYASL